MTLSHRPGITIARYAAIAIAACGITAGAAAQNDSQSAAPVSSPSAIAKARADSARYPYTAADIHFMSGMIGHHAQAIAMSKWAATHDASPAIQTLAGRIINAQRDEIASMQTWLRDRQQPVPDPDPAGVKMMMNGTEQMMLMPGMLTPEQMQQLDQAKGREFDQLFLKDMIQHHRGAVAMVKELFATYGAGQDEIVFKFASDANVDQTTEIARMERMLFTSMIESRAP